MLIHARMHETGPNGRVRLWTDEMQGYGSFELVDNADAQKFKKLLETMNIAVIKMHHCQSYDDCECRCLMTQEKIGDY